MDRLMQRAGGTGRLLSPSTLALVHNGHPPDEILGLPTQAFTGDVDLTGVIST
jgi:hypothetical protein